MRAEPCKVCSGTELTLIDGFYYCVECNTQNTDVRETVVEQKALGDGTFALATRKKLVILDDSKAQMSGEWYKWHAFNFIISGLADELVAAGAKPTFKVKLLWIWTRYIKKYQNKEELVLVQKDGNKENLTLPTFLVEENENSTSSTVPDEEQLDSRGTVKKSNKRNKNVIMEGSHRDIKFISKGLIIAMLYLALNLDESDIQLSHLYRFIKEKHLNFSNIQRLVPEEINLKKIQEQWLKFIHSKVCNMHQVRALAMSLLRILDLGTPKVPDLRKIVDNILTELCLPNDMKPLIYSLMQLHRCDFLDMSSRSKEYLLRVPDYESTVMTYVLVAMKMCFGLDGDYEERLSDAVERINDERDLPKSHRFGKYSDPSNRLFSFREWSSYMQFRKTMLCKCCLKMAEQHCLEIDDYFYMEHLPPRPQHNKDLQDETAIDLISKIPQDDEIRVIPKDLFLPSLTPMADYTDIIIEHSQDEEMRYLLSEDFTQYSLKYACEYLDLKDANAENIIKGVSEDRKTISKVILGTIITKKSKSEMVYVKNCENRNWMKTNPPTMEHVICEDKINENNDRESDHGYDSENPANEKEVIKDSETLIDDTDQIIIKDNQIEHKQGIITEEEEGKNIYDDLFEELDIKDEIEQNNFEDFDLNNYQRLPTNNSIDDDRASMSDMSDIYSRPFNPETFDREQTIKELILNACRKYKIPVPSEYRTREPRKRKANTFGNEERVSTKRAKPGESKRRVEQLISDYFTNLQSDLLNKMHEEVSLAIRNTQLDSILNTTNNEIANTMNIEASDAISRRSSILVGNLENQSLVNPQNSILELTDKEHSLDKTEDIDEDMESKLFDENEEMKLDDLIPKGDPKFDEEKYDVNQLYIKIKVENDDFCNIEDDPKLGELISKKIEECQYSTEFAKLKAGPREQIVQTKYETESDDEIPLNELQEEKKLIEEKIAWEENFEPFIKKEYFSEFKYWCRHYDTDFMTRSMDWHKKFDEELKENTPSHFYFVIRECATILNSSTFYLYKNMQNLEQFIIAMAKNSD